MPDPIRINGQAFDFGSVRQKLDGVRLEGITSIKYSHKRERTKVTGLVRNRVPLGVTPGKYNAEDGAVTAYTSTADYLRRTLATRTDGLSYGDRIFVWTVQYVSTQGGVITDELRGCWIIGDGASLEDNADPSKEEIPIGVLEIIRNGVRLSSRSFP